MKDVIIYGAGVFGNRLLNRVNQYYSEEIAVSFVVDANKEGTWNGHVIKGITSLRESDLPVVIAIENRNVVNTVYSQIKGNGNHRFFVFLGRCNPRYDADDFFEAECIELTSFGNTIIPHIETHAVDHCNLNCKACIHYSALYSADDFCGDYIYGDMSMLSGVTKDVMSFYVMGGEPLLRKDLSDVAVKARELFPMSDIQILTNGILISDRYDTLWKEMRRNNITLTISEYKPLRDHFDKVRDVLIKNKVYFVHRPYSIKDRFIKTICISTNSPYENICICDGCINIYKGMIARCPAVMYLNKLNDTFDLSLPQDGIYSLDEFKNAESIVVKMRERIPLCNHCIKYEVEWEQCEKEKCVEDFVVLE